MTLRPLACALFGLGSLASPAARANSVAAIVRIEDGEPVQLTHDGAAGGPREIVWFDGGGQACAAVMDVDDLGEKTVVAVRVRCYDERGRATVKSEPQVLTRWGEGAAIKIGVSGEQPSMTVDITTAIEEGPADEPLVIRRTFFAEEGRSLYRWYSPRQEAAGFVCGEGITIARQSDGLMGEVRGQFRRGDRIEVPCTMTTQGAAEVPVQLSLWFL